MSSDEIGPPSDASAQLLVVIVDWERDHGAITEGELADAVAELRLAPPR